jgi:hypothetical protein
MSTVDHFAQRRVVRRFIVILSITYVVLVFFGGRIPQNLILVVTLQLLWQSVEIAWLRLHNLTSPNQLPLWVRLTGYLVQLITLAAMAAVVVRYYR